MATSITPPRAPTVPATKPTCRYFYRCQDCLSVAVTEIELTAVYDYKSTTPHIAHYAFCDACEGEVEYMGKAYRKLLLSTEFRCPCDGRCTGAIGPSCDCQCGGENHGTGRLVEVVTHAGALPSLRIPPDAVRIAEEFRAAKKAVSAAWEARFGSLFTRKRRGEFLYDREFRFYCYGARLWAMYTRAAKGKTHKGRMKALAAVLDEIKNN